MPGCCAIGLNQRRARAGRSVDEIERHVPPHGVSSQLFAPSLANTDCFFRIAQDGLTNKCCQSCNLRKHSNQYGPRRGQHASLAVSLMIDVDHCIRNRLQHCYFESLSLPSALWKVSMSGLHRRASLTACFAPIVKEQCNAAFVGWAQLFHYVPSNKGAIKLLLSFENRRRGFTEGELMGASKLVIVIGLMTALVTLSAGLMRDTRLILAIGLVTVLAILAGCAGGQMLEEVVAEEQRFHTQLTKLIWLQQRRNWEAAKPVWRQRDQQNDAFYALVM